VELNSFWETNHTWKLIDIAGSATNTGSSNFATITNGSFGGRTFSTFVGDGTSGDAGSVYLSYIASLMPVWTGAVSSDWATSGNWSTGVVVEAGGQALFVEDAVNKTVDLGGTRAAGTVRFASNASYAVQGGTLQLDNLGQGAQVVVEAGSTGEHTISASLQIVDDASIRVESGRLNVTGGVSINPGRTLSVLEAPAGALTINAINGGTGTLSMAGGTVTQITADSSVGELAMAGSARLDLATADLSIASGSLGAINALVASGRNGGTWDGDGINSSALAVDGDYRTLAVLPQGAGVQVKYTWAGDLTGDGIISGSDYFQMDLAFLQAVAAGDMTGKLYKDGDIDYSGVLDGDDFFRMDQAYLNQNAVLSAGGLTGAAGSAGVAVPEPSTLGLLAIGALGLLARRRRQA
jgi:hypothetical protein